MGQISMSHQCVVIALKQLNRDRIDLVVAQVEGSEGRGCEYPGRPAHQPVPPQVQGLQFAHASKVKCVEPVVAQIQPFQVRQ